MGKSLKDFVTEARARVRELKADELDEMIEDHDEILIVDVREADEYAKGHMPGALLVPRGTLEGAADPNYKHRIEALCNARDKTIVMVCSSGGRSAMAAATLQQMGFERVYNLAGGIEMWEAEGMPLVKD